MKDTGYRESQAADMLSDLPFWEHLEYAQKRYAEDHAVFRHYGKGSMIYSSGSLCLGMACVQKGSVRVYLLSEEGREITLSAWKRGIPACCPPPASSARLPLTPIWKRSRTVIFWSFPRRHSGS